MEQFMWIIWLSLFVVMQIVEALGPNLVSIWFSFGALVSLIVSFIPGVPWWVEVIVFVVISAATLLSLRPVFRKYLKRNDEHIINNLYKNEISIMKIKKSYIIINSNSSYTDFFPILNNLCKYLFVCDFNNQDYFYLANLKMLV